MSKGVSLVGSGDGATEGLRGLFCGVVFGLVSPLIGHPLDSIKSKMQAQPDYLHGSALSTLTKILRNEGFLALYRGLLPPLMGSSVFRSVQFSAYGFAQGASRDSPGLCAEIPFSGGMQWRVVTSGVFAATCRALIESPLEFVKVRRQTGQSWRVAPTVEASLRNPAAEVAALYTGFSMTWARTAGLMTSFFMMVDHLERRHPDLVSVPLLGPFIKGGVCATIGWIIVWPFENLKNQMQANTAGAPPNSSAFVRARFVLRHRGGVVGLYRGIGPGLARSLIANGLSMVVFNACQATMRDLK